MRQRGVHAELRNTSGAEKQFRDQAETYKTSNMAREGPAAKIVSPPRYLKGVTGEIPIGAEKPAGTLPEIGNDHNVGLVISGAGFDPCLPLAHVVGCSHVCVSVTASDLHPTEFVDQKEIDHAGNRVGAIHRRRAILQDVDVINHWKRK